MTIKKYLFNIIFLSIKKYKLTGQKASTSENQT